MGTLFKLPFRLLHYPGAALAAVAAALILTLATTSTKLSAPVETISLSGRALALGLAAAVGFYMVRRRSEFMVLAAQGVGGARLGVRAMAEAVLPTALGGLAGWELALVLGRHFDPLPVVSAAVVRAAARHPGHMDARGPCVRRTRNPATSRSPCWRSTRPASRVAPSGTARSPPGLLASCCATSTSSGPDGWRRSPPASRCRPRPRSPRRTSPCRWTC